MTNPTPEEKLRALAEAYPAQLRLFGNHMTRPCLCRICSLAALAADLHHKVTEQAKLLEEAREALLQIYCLRIYRGLTVCKPDDGLCIVCSTLAKLETPR